ncbi:MAG: biopolymer transporter ExbD [Quisquiliibacterium sp.]
MNFRRGLRRDEPEINFIALIDVLLVVLIFLMVSTTFSKFTELQVNLPSASAQKPADPPRQIVIGISADGRYLIENRLTSFTSPAAMADQLRAAAAGDDRASIVIHADAGATHQSVVNVLEAARLAGLARVNFAAQAPGGR